jgi:UDP-N-acetylglucosamine 1-carboxyvinyltransferase
MARFVIRGGTALRGVHRTPGNKNAVLPMLAATVLTDQPVRLDNVPRIDDVHTTLALLEHLGADVRLRGHTVTVCAAELKRTRLEPGLCGKVRSSILLAGPLAARHGCAVLAPPGGDVIGRRRLDTHFGALSRLGIAIEAGRSYRFTRRRGFRGADILLDEASVTATENAVMAAALAPGTTTLFNAACEPHVQDLCTLLQAMGADIAGVGTNRLIVRGVRVLGGARRRVGPDLVEAASFLAAAAVTRGEVTVTGLGGMELLCIDRTLRKLGVPCRQTADGYTVRAHATPRIQNDFGDAIPRIEDGPWPALPSDLMSVMIVLATQAAGSVLFFEKMFESRMVFVDRLIEMGARIVRCDPHRVLVSGPARLRGMHLTSPDIRAGIALLIAALCAEGESVIDHAEVIDRGYERVDGALRALGAEIVRKRT